MKSEKASKRVSLEVVDEKPSRLSKYDIHIAYHTHIHGVAREVKLVNNSKISFFLKVNKN